MKTYTICLLSVFVLQSCSRSLVYSPAVSLPFRPLSENQIDLQGSAELLPETRPSHSEGLAAPGISGQLTYGFSDRLAIGLRGWAATRNWNSNLRTGYSLHAQYRWQRAPNQSLYLIPRVGMALNGNWIEGLGLSHSIIWKHQPLEKLSYYFGFGAAFGHTAFNGQDIRITVNRSPMGFAGLAHLGIQWAFAEKAYLNLEANPILFFNAYDQENGLLLSPQLSIGYTLGPH
ncbi:hypothetical protein [Phaeodactylibacter sp.]|uniref:hypothetical protein n=1 Tax=Phaeodactylibacter sp. TaxID=1940289 RepID=UPI0025FA0983|nr:hypothetical protein [Phaeodactylibacter sp.]MCI4646886.1 hypothetical protein [Phaeodactylibacter sp.]MCI5089982.1 hypothetical protein [Phaeodactylibacter sp.]